MNSAEYENTTHMKMKKLVHMDKISLTILTQKISCTVTIQGLIKYSGFSSKGTIFYQIRKSMKPEIINKI